MRSDEELNVSGLVLNQIGLWYPKPAKIGWVMFDFIEQQFRFKYENTNQKVVAFQPTPADVLMLSNDTRAVSPWKAQWLYE